MTFKLQDVCTWINELLPDAGLSHDTFLSDLSTGILLLDIRKKADPDSTFKRWGNAIPESFQARDNIAQFLRW